MLNDVNSFFAKPLPANNFSSGIAIQVPLLSMGQRARAREAGADALRATVEAEQAERQSDIQISDLSNSIRELGTLAEIADLKQQIASEQLQTVLTQLELGNGAGSSAGAPPQLTPKAVITLHALMRPKSLMILWMRALTFPRRAWGC